LFAATIAIAAAAALGPRGALAQSTNQLGAWDGLMLSPVGAVAPVARGPAGLAPGANELTLRYGRWSYDSDDAIHDSFGLTWTRGVRFAHAELSVTGAYELVECPTCTAWASGEISAQTTLLSHGLSDAARRSVQTGLALKLSVGGAKYLGAEASTAGSAAITVPLALALPIGKSSQFNASLVPGFGFGHVTGTDFGAGGFLPMTGAAVSWSMSRLSVNVGAQRVFISGGPTQVGAALSYKLGSATRTTP
jgi:hypothetical protein